MQNTDMLHELSKSLGRAGCVQHVCGHRWWIGNYTSPLVLLKYPDLCSLNWTRLKKINGVSWIWDYINSLLNACFPGPIIFTSAQRVLVWTNNHQPCRNMLKRDWKEFHLSWLKGRKVKTLHLIAKMFRKNVPLNPNLIKKWRRNSLPAS